MASKFLNNNNGVDLSSLQDGTFPMYIKSIKVNDLDPNMAVSADPNKFLNSTSSGSGNMNYTGATTATNKIYKASGATGLDAVASSITDDGTNCIVSATNGITANKIIKSGGTAIQYLMADGSVLTQSANSGNSNFYLYQNKDGITTPPPLAGDVGYDTVRQDEATFVYISHLTQDAIDIEVFFKQVNQLNDLYLQDKESSINFIKYNITGLPQLLPNSYLKIPVVMSSYGGTGNNTFGVNHRILVAFFSNNLEIDQRLSDVETKTQNQTAAPGTTTFDGVVSSLIGQGTLKFTDLYPAVLHDLNIGTQNTLLLRLGPAGIFIDDNTINGVDIINGVSSITSSAPVIPIKRADALALTLNSWISHGLGPTPVTVGLKITTLKTVVVSAVGVSAGKLLSPGNTRNFHIWNASGFVVGGPYVIDKTVLDASGAYVKHNITPLTLLAGTYYFGISLQGGGDYFNQADVSTSYTIVDPSVISAIGSCFNSAPDTFPVGLATGFSSTSFWFEAFASVKVGSVILAGGSSTEFLKGDGTVDTNTYLTESDNINITHLNNALTVLPMTSNILPSGYTASSSGNFHVGTDAWYAFNQSTATYFQSTLNNYNGTTGVYVGSNTTLITGLGSTLGDWLQIQLPVAINVSSYTIDTANGANTRAPSTFYFLYSTDNINWIIADTQTAYQWVSPYSTTFTLGTDVIAKYFRISVSLVGNTGIVINRNCISLNELTLNQPLSPIQVPTLLSNKLTFSNQNELVTKAYVSTYVSTLFNGMPFNSIYGNTTTAATGTRALWYQGITPYTTTINGITIYVDGGGSDTCHFGIYRGYLKAGIGTNPGLNMTLVGQSTASTILTTGLPFNRIPIVAVLGQNLNFTGGEYLTIAFHTSGTSNTFLSSPTAGSTFANLCFTTISNYATTSFPSTITNSSISSPSNQRLCFDLY